VSEPDHARRTAIALTGVFVISFSAIIVRAAHVAPGTAAALRCIYALPVLALIASRAPAPSRRALAPALAGGVVLGLNLVFWHHSIDRIGAGFATVLANTHVVFVLAGVLAAGGAVARRSLLALPLPLAGVVLIGGFGSGLQLDGLGIALALVAGAAYAAFQLLFDRSIRLSGAIAWPLLIATLGAGASALAAAVVSGEQLVPPLSGQAWMLLLALGPQTLGWLLIAHGVVRLRAIAVSLMLTVQPVLTTIWGMLAFGEHMRVLQAAGVVLVLGGVLTARPSPPPARGAHPVSTPT
jgi:drug/metabolite transporter (DMT)-like permease